MSYDPREKDPEEIAEEILQGADEDASADDLTRGTEVYEEVDEDTENWDDGDPEELNFDVEESYGHSSGAFDYDAPENGDDGEDW